MTGYGGGSYGGGLYGGSTGVALLPAQLGGAWVTVEVAWGADPAGDPDSWTWVPVTEDVRVDPGLSWRLGRADESSRSNPATLTLLLDNSSSNYSLGPTSANYPNVRRGTPVRVRVALPDGQGWRTAFLGNADGWSPAWASTRGNVAEVELSASGTLRRLAQGAAPITGPYRRTMSTTSSVVAYWPMEDGELATVLAPAVGTAAMTYLGEVDLAQDSAFLCSDPIPTMGAGSLDAQVPLYTSSAGQHQVRWLAVFPDSPSWSDRSVIARIYTDGSMGRWDLQWRSGGSLTLVGFNADGSQNFDTGSWAFAVNGKAMRMSVELLQEGSDVGWVFARLVQFASGANFVDDDSPGMTKATGRTITRVTRVELAPDGNLDGLSLGHLTVQNVQTSIFESSGPFNAFNNEGVTANPQGRLRRLCSENGVEFTLHTGTVDTLTLSDRMGPQKADTLVDLLRECEDAEQGQLWDGLSAGLAYTTRRRQENADATLTIDAGAGELAPPFEPVDDDQRTRNRVTVKRARGAEATYEDVDGPLGTAQVGVYDDSVTVNLSSDGALPDLAGWLVRRGTATGYRYPSVTVDLGASPHLAGAVLDLIPGARIDVTNLDDALVGLDGEVVPLIVEGIQHRLSPTRWTVTMTCSPYGPFEIAVIAEESGDLADEVFRLDSTLGTSTLTAAVGAGVTSFQVATSGGPLWSTTADDYPLDLEVGGVRVRVTACSGGSSPQTFTTAGTPRALVAGAAVQLYEPAGLGL
ncbi:MAG: hypothetical protein AB7L91_18035 [Dehalococcoidia bacterium]